MPEWLPILILIFAFILLLDAIISFVLYRSTKNDLYQKATIAWGANFINFLIHGAFQNHGKITLFGHSIFFISSAAMACILLYSINENFKARYKEYSIIYIITLVTSLISFEMFNSYLVSALILDLAIASVFFESVFQYYKSKNPNPFLKIYSILLILNALHFLDYPFLHDSPKGSIFGFSLAFLLTILMSILLPSMILQLRMSKYTNELEEVVKVRTSELMKHSFELEERHKDVSTLLSIVSHDISNPLLMMGFNIRTLKKEFSVLSSVGQTSLDKIEKSLNAVTAIIKTVKELHATKLGKIEPKKVEINVIPLIEESIQIFQNRLDEKEIKINLEYDMHHPIKAIIDPLLFVHQVLGNLVSNAIKFSPPKSKIDIVVSKIEGYIVVMIRDYGVGIPQNKVGQIFEVSTSTTTSGTQNEKGTGLGLPTVKAILDKMDGLINVESFYWEEDDSKIKTLQEAIAEHKNFGTTFYLKLKSVS